MTEHLLVLPDRDAAEEVADGLRALGHDEVRVVREALAGEDDAEDHDWVVLVTADGDDAGLTARLADLAEAHDGWYDPDPGG